MTREQVDPLKIKALCHLSELSNDYTSDIEEVSTQFVVGKAVRGEIYNNE